MDIDKQIEKFKKDVRDSSGANKARVSALSSNERNKELMIESDGHFWFMDKAGFKKQDVEYSLLINIDRETILKYIEVTE